MNAVRRARGRSGPLLRIGPHNGGSPTGALPLASSPHMPPMGVPYSTSAENFAAHEHSRSWIEARDGQPLDIYIDIIPEHEFEQREREIDALHRELIAAWK